MTWRSPIHSRMSRPPRIDCNRRRFDQHGSARPGACRTPSPTSPSSTRSRRRSAPIRSIFACSISTTLAARRFSSALPASANGASGRNPIAMPTIVTGRGLAYVKYELVRTYVGVVAEVEVNRKTGELAVKRFYVAHDCGQIINPDGLRNQIEGCIVQTVSRTLKEEVTFDRSMVTSLDWASYPILTFCRDPGRRDRPDRSTRRGAVGRRGADLRRRPFSDWRSRVRGNRRPAAFGAIHAGQRAGDPSCRLTEPHWLRADPEMEHCLDNSQAIAAGRFAGPEAAPDCCTGAPPACAGDFCTIPVIIEEILPESSRAPIHSRRRR